jgi:transposase
MIDYETFHRLRQLHDVEHLSASQIAAALELDERTTAKWIECKTYQPRQGARRASKIDPYKKDIVRWLASHSFTAQQLFQRLRDAGYQGGYSILKDYVREVRPPSHPAFLTLRFAPGQCAQVDWGFAGMIPIGSTRRHLNFFVMVLAHSRRLYAEFTLAQTQEHFLDCHQRAFEYFPGVPAELMVDNCKTAVLSHPMGGPPTFNARYLDFARHYGFTIKACGPRQPHQKGRVENAVGYIKKNFLAGQIFTSLEAANTALRLWLDQVANVRIHGQTHKTPNELFEQERAHLLPLTVLPYDVATLSTVGVSPRCRVTIDTNHYSVPPAYARKNLVIKAYPSRLCFYHENQLITEHPRCYDRYQDFEKPEHVEELLSQRRQARQQQLMSRFLALCAQAREYYQRLKERRANPGFHVQKIVALSEIYGVEKTGRAIEDACAYQAFSCEYIANLLEQQARPIVPSGALHLTRRQDLLDLELPAPDLSLYRTPEEGCL